MCAWTLVGRAAMPDGEELTLYEDGASAMIRAGGLELMSTRAHFTEEWFAQKALRGMDGPCRVLVGGLGLGYTVLAASALLSPAAEIEVVEIVEALVGWHRGPLAKLNALSDPRVRVVVGDVAHHLCERRGAYDALLLDTDNGPGAVVRAPNRALYSDEGIARARAALKTPGVLAVWSAAPDDAFVERLEAGGFLVEVHQAPARGRQGDPEHTIFLART